MVRPALNMGDETRRTRKARGQDASHLLAFSAPTRPAPAPRRSNRRTVGHDENRLVPRDRTAIFLHAAYRFLVKPHGDYTVHFCDPDIHHQWHDVLQVIVPTTSALPNMAGAMSEMDANAYACPICLCTPAAPRMTRCGHIMCFNCLLRYLAMTESDGAGAWRRCPVCSDSIHARDLKAVKWFDPAANVLLGGMQDAKEAAEDQALADVDPSSIVFRLVERQKISTLALPRSSTWPSEAVPPNAAPWVFTPDAAAFARFMLADPDDILLSLRSDLRELDAEHRVLAALGNEGDSELGLIFVDAARQKVREQMVKAEGLKTDAILAARRHAQRAIADAQADADNARASSSSSDDLSASVAALSLAQRSRRNINPSTEHGESTYTFYQAASGQNVFLSALDMKILRSHFGDGDLPATLRVKIEASDSAVVTDDLRKRCRYLSHLPARTDVVFVESDLETSGILPPSSLESFQAALKTRRTKRKERVRREDKALERGQRRAEASQGFNVYVPPVEPIPDAAPPFTQWGDAPVLSTSAPSDKDDGTGPRTVWNTRARPTIQHPPPRRSQVYSDDHDPEGFEDALALEARWDAFEAAAAEARERRLMDDLASSPPTSGAQTPASAPSSAGRGKPKKSKTKIVLQLGGGSGPRL